MARKKAPELSPEAQAANAAGEVEREKEKQGRRKNAEKQKRFRENRKSDGYKRVTLWDDPAPSGQPGRMAGMGYRQVPAWEMPGERSDKGRTARVRLAVQIRESSLHAGARSPQVQKALARATSEFLSALGKSPEGKAVFNDYLELVALIGDPWGEE
jgi:hypothetical protein